MKYLDSEHIVKLNYTLLSKNNSHHSAVAYCSIQHSPLCIRVSLERQAPPPPIRGKAVNYQSTWRCINNFAYDIILYTDILLL
jgi:hypothetical protein